MIKSDQFDGRELAQEISLIPNGKPKMDALFSAIQQADNAQDHYWRLLFRYEYCSEATFYDDPPKAIPTSAEFCSIFEEYGNVELDSDPTTAAEFHLMGIQFGIDPIVSLPQIPLEQWQNMMDEFYRRVKYYHIGLRTYWWQMAQFWQYVDIKQAHEYFEKFWKTGRDGLSDCRACDRAHAVQIELKMGNRAAADQYAKPLDQHRIYFCSTTPQNYWTEYLEYELNQGNLAQAESRANALYRKIGRDKSELSYLSAVLRCWSLTNPDQALSLFEQYLDWSLDMWDQKKVYDFSKASCLCFRQLAPRKELVTLQLPKAFPLWREDGVYATKELTDWFYTQANEIGQRFDQRNHSTYFTDDLALALSQK